MQDTSGTAATTTGRNSRAVRRGTLLGSGTGMVLALSFGLAGCSGLGPDPTIHEVTRPSATFSSSAAARTAADTSARDDHREAEDPGLQIRPTPPRVETSNASIMGTLEEIAPLLVDGTVVALAPVGRAEEAGGVSAKRFAGPYPAGMTIAIPLAAAVLRDHSDHAATAAQAIGRSDSTATQQMVRVLGPDAGRTLGEILAEGGDTDTRIGEDALVAGESIPGGGVRWAAVDQVRFLAGLPCRDYGAELVGGLGAVDDELRWGLGAIGDSFVVSSEMPAHDTVPSIVRQAAIVHVEGGEVAVAIAAEAESVGAARSKVQDAVAGLEQRLGRLYGGTCTP